MPSPLKPSEKRLLIAFGAVVFLLANVLGLRILLTRDAKASAEAMGLQARLRQLDMSKQLADEAARKQVWLDQNLKVYADVDVRDNDLVNFVQALAERTNLELKNPTALDPKAEDGFIKSKFTGEVSGDWGDFLEFVFLLQDTSQFRRVTSLRISTRKSEDQTGASTLVAKMEIEKWWHPESDEILAASEEAAAEIAAEPAPAVDGAAPPLTQNQNEQPGPATVETNQPPPPPPPTPEPAVEAPAAPVQPEAAAVSTESTESTN